MPICLYIYIVACLDNTRPRATYIIAQPIFSTMLDNLSPVIIPSSNKRSRDLMGMGPTAGSPLHVRVRRSWPAQFTERAGTNTSPIHAPPPCRRKLFVDEADSNDSLQHEARDGMEIDVDIEFYSLQNAGSHGGPQDHVSESESDPEEDPSESEEEEEEPVEVEVEEEESDPEEEPFESDPSEPELDSESEEEQIEPESELEEESDEEEDPDEYLVPVTPLKSNKELRGRAVSSPHLSACRYEYWLLIQERGGRVRRMTSRFLFAEDAIDPYNPYLCHPSDLNIIRNPISGKVLVLPDYSAYARRMWGRLLKRPRYEAEMRRISWQLWILDLSVEGECNYVFSIQIGDVTFCVWLSYRCGR